MDDESREVTDIDDDDEEEDDEKEDLSRMLDNLCQTDWYREYERETAGEQNIRKSPVYTEEQESSAEYVKGW